MKRTITNNKFKNVFSNFVGKSLVKKVGGKACYLDSNKILWKFINSEWKGKRSVWTQDFRACWLEDIRDKDVNSWWCGGKNANYSEEFYYPTTIN